MRLERRVQKTIPFAKKIGRIRVYDQDLNNSRPFFAQCPQRSCTNRGRTEKLQRKKYESGEDGWADRELMEDEELIDLSSDDLDSDGEV